MNHAVPRSEPETFGSRLARLREGRALLIVEMALALGVTRQSVWKWETDVVFPRPATRRAIADLLEVSDAYLTFGAGHAVTLKTVQTLPKDARLGEVISTCRAVIADAAGTHPENVSIKIGY